MTDRIDYADMVARVALARDGWLVPGKYLVQSFEDAQALNRIADELVAERDELREKLAAAQAKLDAVPVGAIAAALDKSEIGASGPEDYVFYKQLVAWLSDIHGSGYEFMKGREL